MENNIRKVYLFNFLSHFHLLGGVLIPFFTIWGGLSLFETMVILSAYHFAIVLFEVPSGALADILGRKYTLALSGVLLALAGLVYVLTKNFYVFLLAEIIWAISWTMKSGSDKALAYDTMIGLGIEKESKRVFTKMDSYTLAAFMIAGPLGSLVGATLGLEYVMIFMIIPALGSTVVALTMKETVIKKEKRMHLIETIREGLGYLRKNRPFLYLTIDLVLLNIVIFSMIWFYQMLLMRAGLAIIWLGWVHAFILLAEIIILNKWQWFERILGSKKLMLSLSSLIPGVLFIISGYTMSLFILIPVIMLILGFGIPRETIIKNYLNKHIPSYKRATVLSTAGMIGAVLSGIVRPIYGLLADFDLTLTMVLLGVMAIVFTLGSKIREDMLVD